MHLSMWFHTVEDDIKCVTTGETTIFSTWENAFQKKNVANKVYIVMLA